MEPVPFVEMRLQGTRFTDPGMPVEALTELVAYRELLIETAKEVFFKNNPSRQRVPKGFTERLRLRLRDVEEGSVVSTLERIESDAHLAFMPKVDEFSTARRLIESAINAVNENRELPEEFPRRAVGYFNRFGRSLQAGEAIGLREPGTKAYTYYSPRVRRQLLLTHTGTYRADRSQSGKVVTLYAESFVFDLRTPSGAVAKCHFGSELFEFVHSVLKPEGDGPMIRVTGDAVLDQFENITRIDVIEAHADEDDNVADNPDEGDALTRRLALERLAQRLEELHTLSPDWLDGAGEPPNSRVLVQVARLLTENIEIVTPGVRLYPMPDGGVQLEWSLEHKEYSIEIHPDLSVDAIVVDPATGNVREQSYQKLDQAALQVFLLGGAAS